MNTSPGIDGLLEGVVLGIGNELMPYLSNEKAQASAAMMQSILQAVRQIIPMFDAALIDEHNAMTVTLRTAAECLAAVTGEEADAVRARASSIGQRADYPAPPDREEVVRAHTDLGRAVEASILDLDVIQREGGAPGAAADEALAVIRAHLAPRYLRDFQAITVGAGFLGRS